MSFFVEIRGLLQSALQLIRLYRTAGLPAVLTFVENLLEYGLRSFSKRTVLEHKFLA